MNFFFFFSTTKGIKKKKKTHFRVTANWKWCLSDEGVIKDLITRAFQTVRLCSLAVCSSSSEHLPFFLELLYCRDH